MERKKIISYFRMVQWKFIEYQHVILFLKRKKIEPNEMKKLGFVIKKKQKFTLYLQKYQFSTKILIFIERKCLRIHFYKSDNSNNNKIINEGIKFLIFVFPQYLLI